MEAKDTVKFKLEELNKLPHMGSLNKDVIEMLEAQAEISFPLGKQEGMQEVVEWMKGHILRCETERGIAYIQDIILFRFTKEEWQAFLKERGLEK